MGRRALLRRASRNQEVVFLMEVSFCQVSSHARASSRPTNALAAEPQC